MKTWLLIGGPLIVFTGFAFHSDLLTFGNQHPGMVHVGGVAPGGTLVGVHEEVYHCDEDGNNCALVEERTEFTEVSGLEIEEQPIEYRDGIGAEYNKTKQPGLTKYANISVRRPRSFEWSTLKFTFDPENPLEDARRTTEESTPGTQSDEEGEMVQIDPPTLVIPAN